MQVVCFILDNKKIKNFYFKSHSLMLLILQLSMNPIREISFYSYDIKWW